MFFKAIRLSFRQQEPTSLTKFAENRNDFSFTILTVFDSVDETLRCGIRAILIFGAALHVNIFPSEILGYFLSFFEQYKLSFEHECFELSLCPFI